MVDTLLNFAIHGLLAPSPLFLILFVISTSFLTLMAVTCYLHRSQTHRSIRMVPLLNHIFRLILWLFTGMVTKEWVAVHRKHHAYCDTPLDPHSPKFLGLKKVFWEGADIYSKFGRNNKLLLEEFGKGTPDDWLERVIYGGKYRQLGIVITLILELILFGLPGLIIWPIQMMVIPIIAAGFINGVAHVWGYQRYKDGHKREDGKYYINIGDARNVPTYGLAVGEEFHNNHHAYQERYKFSHAWYELDVGGTFLELMCIIGFARVTKEKW